MLVFDLCENIKMLLVGVSDESAVSKTPKVSWSIMLIAFTPMRYSPVTSGPLYKVVNLGLVEVSFP